MLQLANAALAGKRRKIRCSFRVETDAVCESCMRRGTTCISQEFPDEPSRHAEGNLYAGRGGHAGGMGHDDQQMRARLVRVEALLERLAESVMPDEPLPSLDRSRGLKRAASASTSVAGDVDEDDDDDDGVGGACAGGKPFLTQGTQGPGCAQGGLAPNDGVSGGQRIATGIPTPKSDDGGIAVSHPGTGMGSLPSKRLSKHEKVRRALWAILPSQHDANILMSAAHGAIFLQVIKRPYSDLVDGSLEPADVVARLPSPNAHPTIIARYLLGLAVCVQQLPNKFETRELQMTESPRVAMARWAATAAKCVKSDDELIASVEGTECLVLEGLYQTNMGNLRRAWMSMRHALSVAQMVGLHREKLDRRLLRFIDPDNRIVPHVMWSRIVYADRYLSILLGLPAGTSDNSFASEARLRDETPAGRLERIHSVIIHRIIERNQRDPLAELGTTQEIDNELQRAARSMPARWWLMPTLGSANEEATPQQHIAALVRIMNQLCHYGLLTMVHLPYLLRVSPDRRYDYSKITCVNASREMLLRFIHFRTFNHTSSCCRTMDFAAFTGALTLLLAHLDSHRPGSGFDAALLSTAPGRASDRDLIEQALQIMENLYATNGDDYLSRHSAAVLRQLLVIEADAAAGTAYRTDSSARPADAAAEAASDSYACGPPAGYGDDAEGETDEGRDAKRHRCAKDGSPECSGSLGNKTGKTMDTGKGDDEHVLRITIPYFGTIRIAREGLVRSPLSMAAAAVPGELPSSNNAFNGMTKYPSMHADTQSIIVPPAASHQQGRPQSSFPDMASGLFSDQLATAWDSPSEQQQRQQPTPGSTSASATPRSSTAATPLGSGGPTSGLASAALFQAPPTPGRSASSGVPQQMVAPYVVFRDSSAGTATPNAFAAPPSQTFPGLMSDADDWAFQGVDMVFFDSLLRGDLSFGSTADQVGADGTATGGDSGAGAGVGGVGDVWGNWSEVGAVP